MWLGHFVNLVAVSIALLLPWLIGHTLGSLPNPNECGVSNVPLPRVVGGARSSMYQWPWMAAIFLHPFGKKPNRHVSCGGVLISHWHVLTAAHCVTRGISNEVLPPTDFLIRLGDNNINWDTGGADPHEFNVDRVVPHEKYHPDPLQIKNDIALLRLEKSVAYSSSIRPICLPKPEMAQQSFYRYQPFIAGWGRFSYGGERTSYLHHVQLQVISNEECAIILANILGATLTDKQLCTGDSLNDKDTCQGDSGGPLMLLRANRWHTIGVISTGWRCAEKGFPAIYTRVTHYLDWIITHAV